ncbi:MAG: penicillin-binding protein activator [Gammaproteobacteria bacterium]|nr:penicillin-binding protein activator [Gammaproteobacteria bacterium]
MTRPICNGGRRQAYAKPRCRFTPTVVAVLALAVVAGCQSASKGGQDPTRGAPAAVVPPVLDPAAQASEWARRVQHAWSLLDAGDAAAAQAVRNALGAAVPPGEPLAGGLAGEYAVELDLLDAGLALRRGDVDTAAETLRTLGAGSVTTHLRFALLRAEVAAARGDHAGAVAVLIAVEARTGAEVLTLGNAIWRHGMRVEGYRLADLATRARSVGERAWWRFLQTYNEALTPARQRTLWTGWRQGHPDHPAALARPPGLDAPGPRRIAVLLPLSGSLANAGERVRDGFLAGYYAAGPLPTQSVALYDTAAAPVDALYEEAMAGGAEAIVGPLSKENVARMWDIDPVLPTVTLNTIAPRAAGAGAPRLIQFALAVEDEGRALAQRIGVDGRRRILVFRTRADWSERAAVALETHLPDAVELVDVGVFPDVREVTNVVGAALAIEESQARQTALARLFPGVEVGFTARRRADVHAVVALLDGDHADSLAAALRFHYAANLPVYGSSQALRGGARAREGMRVCDMPWRLYPSALKAALQDPFPAMTDNAESLFAFGVDAFRIVNRLSWLASSPEHRIMGASGVLGLGPDGSVHREPAWAMVRDGGFQPLPPPRPRRGGS